MITDKQLLEINGRVAVAKEILAKAVASKGMSSQNRELLLLLDGVFDLLLILKKQITEEYKRGYNDYKRTNENYF